MIPMVSSPKYITFLEDSSIYISKICNCYRTLFYRLEILIPFLVTYCYHSNKERSLLLLLVTEILWVDQKLSVLLVTLTFLFTTT